MRCATSGWIPRSTPLFQGHPGCEWLAVPHDLHFYRVADVAAAQGIREVVEILDGFAVELHQNVIRLQSRLTCGRAFLYVRKLYAALDLPEIGDGAEIWTIAAPR